MPPLPTSLTQMGYLPQGYFDRPPQCNMRMDDSEAQAEDDINEDTSDMQDLESNDPTRHMLADNEVRTIGMYAS